MRWERGLIGTGRFFLGIGCLLLLAAGGVVLVFLLLSTREGAPPLIVVDKEGSKTVLGMETLGEYPSTVDRMRIQDRTSGAVVWEARCSPERKSCQAWRVEVVCGANAAGILSSSHEYIETPAPPAGFELSPGRTYVFEAWGTGEGSQKRAFSPCEG